MSDSTPLPAETGTFPVTPKEQNVMTFPQAIQCVIKGQRVSKREWDAPALYLALVNDKLILHKEDGLDHQVLLSSGDLLGEDWFTLPGQPVE